MIGLLERGPVRHDSSSCNMSHVASHATLSCIGESSYGPCDMGTGLSGLCWCLQTYLFTSWSKMVDSAPASQSLTNKKQREKRGLYTLPGASPPPQFHQPVFSHTKGYWEISSQFCSLVLKLEGQLVQEEQNLGIEDTLCI